MKILLVEDNKGDQVIMREALQEAQVACHLDIAKDGIEAMQFLKREGQFKNAMRPDLIILDLNMPRKNGREVLAELKANAQLEHIPVVVFSNSTATQDICDCYSLRANVYAGKPSGFQGFVDFAHTIRNFWGSSVRYCSHS